MPRVLYRAIIPSQDYPNWKVGLKVIEDAVDREVKRQVIELFERRVANWTRKPTFKARKSISLEKGIVVYVYPVGPYAEVFKWVTKGVRPHPIAARTAPLLIYQMGYVPKTGPSGAFGGSGDYTGPWRKKKAVSHPGYRAREIEKYVAEEYTPQFRRIMKNAMARAVRKMKTGAVRT